MKLNVKRTVLIGLGFMTIMMLWQVYNWQVPKFLEAHLSVMLNNASELVIGIIMALDNLLAIFMIPLMSNLSDKTRTKMGRRMPYIAVGIVLSAIAFVFLPWSNDTGNFWLLLINVFLVLVFMNIYRSPCVALMPDITPKPLRSKGNSIINIMGGVGFATGYLAITFFGNSIPWLPFVIVSAVMVIALFVLIAKVRENKFVEDYRAQLKEFGISEEEDKKEDVEEGGVKKTIKRNVILSLLIVFFAYMANNSVETFMSLYSKNIFGSVTGLPFNMEAGAFAMMPFGIATFVFALPAAIVANKIGRAKTVMLGAIVMCVSYVAIGLFGMTIGFNLALLVFFLTAGAGFAFITINIYPMVVENCSSRDVGRYTGYYYTASMVAQSVTPALCGLFLGFVSYNSLFPYATVFMLAVILVVCLLRKKKDKVEETETEPTEAQVTSTEVE